MEALKNEMIWLFTFLVSGFIVAWHFKLIDKIGELIGIKKLLDILFNNIDES